MAETKKLASFVLGPDEGESHWQPVPANGFVNNLVSTKKLGTPGRLSMGTQTVAPKSFIREHTHDKNEAIIFVVAGRGIARLEGVDHPIERGSCVYVAVNEKHHFINPHDEPMTFLWVFAPGGLDDFFAEIGRPRTPGQPAPEHFARPTNVAEIEARTVFGWTDASFNQKT